MSVWLRRLALVPLLGLCLLVAPPGVDRPSTAPPLVGFSFSPLAAQYAHLDPNAALAQLLDRIHPDLVRLPIYWGDVAPASDRLDFTSVDAMLQRVSEHNATSARPTRVVLVVGARNLGFPELYVPSWVTVDRQRDVASILRTAAYHRYLETAVRRYRSHSLLYAWQVENEPYDNVVSGAPARVAVASGQLRSEVDAVHGWDPAHRVVVTSYNSATLDLDEIGISPLTPLYHYIPVASATGHPQPALDTGDILGLDVYVSTPSTAPTVAAADATPELTVDKRIRWKRDVLDYWGQRAESVGKEMWITEMQAGSWQGDTSFSEENLLQSATQYADGSATVVLLWGVESWLVNPGWMRTGTTAVAVLRGEDPDHGIDL